MSNVTLDENSTTEDIQAAVDQIAAEADEERQEKTDAQITTEHANNEKKPVAETGDDSAEKEVETSDDSEDSGEEETVDWREDAKAEAAAYGIGKDELAEFQSREELDRALKLFDRQLDGERKKLKEDPKEEKSDEKTEPEGQFDITLDPDVYDDAIIEEFTRMRDHYEAKLSQTLESVSALEERFNAIDAQAAEERFDRSVDALEFSALFGKTGEETPEEMERRKQLFEHVQVEQDVMSQVGRNVPFNALVHRVARSLFPDEYDKRLIKNHTRKISRQTDKRQGGGATRPTDPPEDPREEADRLYREMSGI